MHQKEELVGAMLPRAIRTNRSSQVLCQGLDSILNFVVTLAFPSHIATPLVNDRSEGRSAYNVVRTEDDARLMVNEGPMF